MSIESSPAVRRAAMLLQPEVAEAMLHRLEQPESKIRVNVKQETWNRQR